MPRRVPRDGAPAGAPVRTGKKAEWDNAKNVVQRVVTVKGSVNSAQIHVV